MCCRETEGCDFDKGCDLEGGCDLGGGCDLEEGCDVEVGCDLEGGCNFEESGFCILGTELLPTGAGAFFSMEVGVLEGTPPFGPRGRPGPVPLLVLCSFLESTGAKLGLLAEGNLLDPALECTCPFVGASFRSP